ncbi:MAG TPA: AIR synthase-related protein [Verrucomicrobiae bacterium]|nr:AIR synthase-related protein [Verrucomicrobiae bacterium]
MLFDPQTSGGLLIAVATEHLAELDAALERHAIRAVQIGEVIAKSSPLIAVA